MITTIDPLEFEHIQHLDFINTFSMEDDGRG
jgi:hypothetical protein